MAESYADVCVFILLGPPGVGKGTQAKNLSQYFHLTHISTGDLLREQIHKTTEIGKAVDIYMQSGQLVPNEIILHMLFERISKGDCKKGYILDGFPRTLAQAKKLQVYFTQNKIEPFVFNLDLNDREIIRRLQDRLICTKCHTPYHLFNSPPKKTDICDRCNTHLTYRSDDQPEVISKRLQIYNEQTAPLIMYYKELKLLHTIDCNHTEKEIFHQMLLYLKESFIS